MCARVSASVSVLSHVCVSVCVTAIKKPQKGSVDQGQRYRRGVSANTAWRHLPAPHKSGVFRAP
jgi:hypothetical protein